MVSREGMVREGSPGQRRAIPLSGSALLASMSFSGLGLILQLLLVSRGVSTLWIGVLSSLNGAGILVGGLVWGTISDHIRRKPLLVALAIGLSVSIGVLVMLPSTGFILASAFIRRFMLAGFTTVAVAIVSAASSARRRGRNLSYISSASAAGRAFGLIAAGFILQWVGFQAALAVVAVLPFAILGCLRFLPAGNPIQRSTTSRAWKQVVSAGLVDLYIASALRQMAIFGTFSLLFVYMSTIGIVPGQMGVVSSINTFTQVFAMIAFGWIADRVGRRRIFMLGFALSALTPCMFMIWTSVYGMAFGYIVQGLSFSALHVGATAHIGDRAPEQRHGQLLGSYEFSRGVGGLLGPIVAGILAPAIGFKGMFAAMSGIGGLGFLVLVLGNWLGQHRGSK